MKTLDYQEIKGEVFEGVFASEFVELQELGGLAGLHAFLRGDAVEVLAEGRHRVVVASLKGDAGIVPMAVKCFGKQSAWKDRYDRKRGSKAARSFRAAQRLQERGVGTPFPVGYVERWENDQLAESYYFSFYVDGLTDFKKELNTLYQDCPDTHKLVELLSVVARFIRQMHDAGFYHRDLGNQNVLMSGSHEEGWSEVQVIDLNRGRLSDELTLDERARDFDRLTISGAFLRVILAVYWEGEKMPGDFKEKVQRVRSKYSWHARSRRWRHPSRWFKKKKSQSSHKNIWLWDKRSAQASVVMASAERKKCYPKGHHLESLLPSLKAAPKAWPLYKEKLAQVYGEPVDLSQRIGMSLEAADLDWAKQVKLLGRLEGEQKIPILVRFGHHESPAQWARTARYVKGLAESGHEVMLAILQDRRAILNPESWGGFLREVIAMTQEYVQTVEVCHAVNRTKWGIWSAKEQAVLMEPVRDLQAEFPHLSFTGPACIDFEYHYVLGALEKMPEGLTLGALSHHLYVDRRGAPESYQGKFSLIEKCALLKAIAENSQRCEDEVIVSEVNWPLQGGGVWSPVSATYFPPGSKESSVSVPDDLYAAYMLRYYVIALCSGMVERVYWWRLVSHGFGLVDERPEEEGVEWRERVGYAMLQFFLATVGTATFTQKIPDESGAYFFKFEKEGEACVMAWLNGESRKIIEGGLPFQFREVLSALGDKIETEVTLSDTPVYFLGVEAD